MIGLPFDPDSNLAVKLHLSEAQIETILEDQPGRCFYQNKHAQYECIGRQVWLPCGGRADLLCVKYCDGVAELRVVEIKKDRVLLEHVGQAMRYCSSIVAVEALLQLKYPRAKLKSSAVLTAPHIDAAALYAIQSIHRLEFIPFRLEDDAFALLQDGDQDLVPQGIVRRHFDGLEKLTRQIDAELDIERGPQLLLHD